MHNTPYRVVHHRDRYAIHHVYCDEDGEPWTCSEEPVYPAAHSLEEMARYWSALELPALEYADLVPGDEELEDEIPF